MSESTDLVPVPRKAGRAYAIEGQRRERLLAALAAGGSYADACKVAGVGESTFYRYMAIAQGPAPVRADYATRKGHQDALAHYHRCRDLREDVHATEARSKIALLGRIRRAGQNGDWRADAFLLRIRWPEEYGTAQDRLAIGGGSSLPDLELHVQRLALALDGAMDDVQLTDGQRVALRAALAARLRSLQEDGEVVYA